MKCLTIYHHTKDRSAHLVLRRLAQQAGCEEFVLAGPAADFVDIPLPLRHPGIWELGFRGVAQAVRQSQPNVILNVAELSNYCLWQAAPYRAQGIRHYVYAFDNLCLTWREEWKLSPDLRQIVRSLVKAVIIRRSRRVVDRLYVASQKALRAHRDKWGVSESLMQFYPYPTLTREEMLQDKPTVDLNALDARLLGKQVIGYCGRLIPEKGIALLIALSQRLTANAHLLMIGAGPLESQLANQPAITHISGQSPLAMGHFYRRMRLLLLPSRRVPNWEEQYGRVIQEAKAFDVPVLASRHGSIPEFVPSERLFEENNLEALVQKVREFCPECVH
jgi:glycosyltransferase involved in cell wall biosynthesis